MNIEAVRYVPKYFNREADEVPETSRTGYYFPWSSWKKDYDTSTYDPALSDHQISLEEINNLLNDLRRLPLYNPDPFECLCCVLIAVFIMIPVSIVTIIATIAQTGSSGLVLFSILGVLFLGVVLILSLLCLIQKKRQPRGEKRAIQVDEIIKKHQINIFNTKRVYVHMSSQGAYLCFEFGFRQEFQGDQNPSLQHNKVLGTNAYPLTLQEGSNQIQNKMDPSLQARNQIPARQPLGSSI